MRGVARRRDARVVRFARRAIVRRRARARDALANGDGATRGNGARACADALHATVTREDAPDALKRRGKDVVEALRGEWCFAAARETGREGEARRARREDGRRWRIFGCGGER